VLSRDDNSELGIIKIHNNVIASIAYLATLEIEGVSRICEDVKSSLAHLLGKKTQSGAIDARTEKNNEVTIIIPVIIKYGYKIPDVSVKIQENVKTAVEDATDLTIKDIIIKIKGVEK
jgi:uncharacterized alkaline shock family protein YloU